MCERGNTTCPTPKAPMTSRSDPTAPSRDVLDDAAEVFALLSTAGRLHLLWILSNGEVDVTTLVAAVGGTKAGISQHLAKLRLAGWIDGRREGRRIVYRVVDPHILTLVHQGVEHIVDLRAGNDRSTGARRSTTPEMATTHSPHAELGPAADQLTIDGGSGARAVTGRAHHRASHR